MTAAFVVVVALALILQVVFTVRYWKRMPSWKKHPYGRLAQLGSWCHIILLSLYLIFIFFGKFFSPTVAGVMLVLSFVPLVFFGFLQLTLLDKAVKESEKESKEAST